MPMTVVIPKNNTQKHIDVLENLIAIDRKKKDIKSLKYHKQALDVLQKQRGGIL